MSVYAHERTQRHIPDSIGNEGCAHWYVQEIHAEQWIWPEVSFLAILEVCRELLSILLPPLALLNKVIKGGHPSPALGIFVF